MTHGPLQHKETVVDSCKCGKSEKRPSTFLGNEKDIRDWGLKPFRGLSYKERC